MMATSHPLRPLGLAVSLRLNHPADLLAELRELPWPDQRGILAMETMRAAVALARAAIAFQEPRNPLEAVRSLDFKREALEAAASLRYVAAIPWPRVSDPDRGMAEAAYLDFAQGCEMLAAGKVLRPDVNNFVTNVTKAIGTIDGRRFTWTFATLPDFA
jgi:hypothetical protein